MQNSKSQFKIQNFLHISQLGFTILEMAVIIAIVGIISATVVFSDKNSSRKRELTLEAQKLAQDLRRAQNMALSSRVSSECGSKVVPYGLFFRQSQNDRYSAAADCNENNVYNGTDTVMSAISFQNVRINSLSANGSGVNNLDVFFIPPVPTTMANGSASFTSAIITLCHLRDVSVCKSIRVNEKGAINAQ